MESERMNLLLFLIVASVSSQDIFSFAGIQNPAVPVEEVKFITPSKSDSIIEFPQPVKTLNGITQFPSNCERSSSIVLLPIYDIDRQCSWNKIQGEYIK